MNKLLTPEEAAEILGISVYTIKDFLRAGKISGVKVGKLWRIEEKVLKEFIEANRTGFEDDLGKSRAKWGDMAAVLKGFLKR
jgi:excisionase family DNA binding protein